MNDKVEFTKLTNNYTYAGNCISRGVNGIIFVFSWTHVVDNPVFYLSATKQDNILSFYDYTINSFPTKIIL